MLVVLAVVSLQNQHLRTNCECGMVRAGLVQWRDHDVGALLMLTKQKWNQMDGDGRWYCDAAELRQLSRSQGGHNGDPCPAWHHDTSRVEFHNFYTDTFAIMAFPLWKSTLLQQIV